MKPTILNIIIFVLIFFLILVSWILFSNTGQDGAKNKTPFRIVHYTCDKSLIADIMSILEKQLGDIAIANVQTEESSMFDQMESKNARFKTLLFYTYHNKHMPYLSGNTENLTDTNSFVTGYRTCFSEEGDSVFIKKFAKFKRDEPISWISNNQFIKERTPSTVFLELASPITSEKQGVSRRQINKRRREEAKTYFLTNKLIITRYLIGNSPAIHVNYILQKEGTKLLSEKQKVISEILIGFLKYISNFIKQNQIAYFSFAGSSGLSSAFNKKYINSIFGNSVYISPGSEENVYVSHVMKDANHSKFFTNDFIVVSKSLAPYGVDFYLTEPNLTYMTNKYVLVAEIHTSPKKDKTKNPNDKTEEILYQVQMSKKIDPNAYLDPLTKDNVSIKNIDPIPASVYKATPASM